MIEISLQRISRDDATFPAEEKLLTLFMQQLTKEEQRTKW